MVEHLVIAFKHSEQIAVIQLAVLERRSKILEVAFRTLLFAVIVGHIFGIERIFIRSNRKQEFDVVFIEIFLRNFKVVYRVEYRTLCHQISSKVIVKR